MKRVVPLVISFLLLIFAVLSVNEPQMIIAGEGSGVNDKIYTADEFADLLRAFSVEKTQDDFANAVIPAANGGSVSYNVPDVAAAPAYSAQETSRYESATIKTTSNENIYLKRVDAEINTQYDISGVMYITNTAAYYSINTTVNSSGILYGQIFSLRMSMDADVYIDASHVAVRIRDYSMTMFSDSESMTYVFPKKYTNKMIEIINDESEPFQLITNGYSSDYQMFRFLGDFITDNLSEAFDGKGNIYTLKDSFSNEFFRSYIEAGMFDDMPGNVGNIIFVSPNTANANVSLKVDLSSTETPILSFSLDSDISEYEGSIQSSWMAEFSNINNTVVSLSPDADIISLDSIGGFGGFYDQ